MLLSYIITITLSSPITNKKILEALNAIPGKTWEATDSSRIAQMSDESFQAMLIDRKFLRSRLPVSEFPLSADIDVPEAYDYLKKYPQCESEVFDQGHCGSCWAFAATSTLSDRRCVAGRTNTSVAMSQQYELSCDMKDAGCNGGSLHNGWDFFWRIGVPTLDCVDYSDEAFYDGTDTGCPRKCDDGTEIVLTRLSNRGMNVGGSAERIKAVLYVDGPVLTGFDVYQDFKMYKSGIYKHLTGERGRGHAVEIVGYGSENGTDFWRIRNSWGEDWGEDGFFRIVRGVNECTIEHEVIAGIV